MSEKKRWGDDERAHPDDGVPQHDTLDLLLMGLFGGTILCMIGFVVLLILLSWAWSGFDRPL